MPLFRIILMIVGVCSATVVSPAAAVGQTPLFETDIQPIFQQKCGKCHSDQVHKGDLDLSSLAGVRRGGASGEDLIDESVEDNWLWIMLDEGEMPPAGEPSLSDKQRALVRRWIAAGAPSESAGQRSPANLTQHDVLPVLLLRCTACHGPRLREGGLDLRSLAAMRKGGEHGPALVPGDPAASPMIQRIESEACPPRGKLLKFFVRRPTNAELETLREWIAAGAPEIDVPADAATEKPDPQVTDEDRQHWAFQPPGVRPGEHSIDRFVGAKLQEHALTFSPRADRDTLIRRAYLDLIGMPPSLDEWRQWREDDNPDWYAAMIDHLLASPHYGERWGRYWLDLAGYADSEGGVSADPIRSVAWKYRDYVIDAFNDDKPYDRFLLEQLAGDELVDYEQADVVTPQMVENLIATGFLRMGIDQTGSRTMNFVPERLGVIGDAVAVVSSGVMGLTMECARCHSHKYDPIPHRDYYRFKAVFQGALDEHDWLSFKTRYLNVATPEHRQRVAETNPPLEAELKKLASRERNAIADLQLAILRHHYPDQQESDRQETLAALKIADNNRTLPQKILVEKLQRAELLPDERQPQAVHEARRLVQTIERQTKQLRRQLEPPLAIRALWDRGEPSPTYILHRGEHNKPGRLVGPGVPSVLTDGQTPFPVVPPFRDGTMKTGRRLALARWLTKPDHPLTARVMVNRIWYHHFGNGLVRTLENFGRQGDRPSHPELLDWLAMEFVERGWSVKEMHRLIMNSRVYKQSSCVREEDLQQDPSNRFLSRMPLRRMNAEALRDSLLFVAGSLVDEPGGPPDPVSVDRNGLVSADPLLGEGRRRSIYLQYRRTEIPTIMDTFDYPEMGPNCLARNVSTVSPQSLMLMNNAHVRQLAAAFATRVEELLAEREVGNSAHSPAASEPPAEDGQERQAEAWGERVDAVYRMALSRSPSEQERRVGIEALQELQTRWQEKPEAALETYCHTILNSAAFLYID